MTADAGLIATKSHQLHKGKNLPCDHLPVITFASRVFATRNNYLPKTACLWIGPEGDFTPVEMELIVGSGALPVTLGSLVLRSDTAAIYGLSVMNYELQYVG